MSIRPQVESVVLKGKMHFIGNPESTFKGPIKKGMRPIAWYEQPNGESTSCQILSDLEIQEGETKQVEIVLLNQLQLGRPILIGMVLNIGTTVHKLAEFTVEEHLGLWKKD
jgi:hypothetical protein